MNIGDTAKLTNPQDSGFGRTESAPAGRGPGTARVNTNPEYSPETILRLFVYGTLKRGYWNHQRFCAQARSIEPAVVWGRLYHLHAGFPALEVPEGLILSQGTADPLADARRQEDIGTPRFGRPTGDWDLIHGGTGDLHRPATQPAAHRPAGRFPARRTQHLPAGDGACSQGLNRLCCMDLHHVCASERRTYHQRQSGRFLEKSSLFGTKRLILAIHQCSLWRLICGTVSGFRVSRRPSGFTENMMNEGRRLWMRDG